MASPAVGKVNPLNYLGIEKKKFAGQIRAMAIADPVRYGKMRQYVIDIVKDKAVENIFDTFYGILTDGTIQGRTIFQVGVGGETLNLKPSVPNQEVNEFCLSVTHTLDDICQKCIDKILPDESALLGARFSEIGKLPEQAGVFSESSDYIGPQSYPFK